MGYDPNKDVILAEKQVQVGKQAYKIGLYQYNGGEVKAGINNIYVLKTNGEVRTKSVGRMTADVLKVFVATIQELKGQMVAVPQQIAQPQIVPVAPAPVVITPVAPPTPQFSF